LAPARVPGDVRTSLLEIGRLAPPFYNMNVKTCQWVEDQEWWYRTTFEAPPARNDVGIRYLLTFDGLDSLTTVYLNGIEVGSHRNMFIPAVFDVTPYLRPAGPNTLAVRFDPIAVKGRVIESQWGRNPERVWVRKAQYGFGWDFAPRLISVGIWQGVTLRRFLSARLKGIFFKTARLAAGAAEVVVIAEVERWAEVPELTVQVTLSRGGRKLTTEAPVVEDRAEVSLTVPNPDLWWTHDLGEPALYDLEVALRAGTCELDRQTERVGIRTIRLDRSPDPEEPGTRFFTFVLNGVRVFCRGASWVPADSFPAQVDKARYRRLLKLAAKANMNMLRVWGGGIYEKDALYRPCDELGILVWQDSMFACARYPEDLPFLAEAEREAEEVVRRLRNHPSLALWCGNNENDWLEEMQGLARPEDDFPGRRIYHELLPSVVERLDGTRPYWPSSPYGGNDHNDERDGDRHNWQVWHGLVFPRRFGEGARCDLSPEGGSFRHYARDTSRFVSEFGIQAAPVLERLSRNIPAAALRPDSPELLWRNQDFPKDKGKLMMLAHTGLPRSLCEYIDFSMICQAEGLKLGIEHWRRRKFHTSGTFIWQLNDPWPGITWSLIDYYLFPKASYFYVKRAYSPGLASFQEEGNHLSLWIVNNTLRKATDTLSILHGDFSGEKLREEVVEFTVPPNAAKAVWTCPFSELGIADPRREFMAVRSHGGLFPQGRHFFVEIKHLKRPRPNLRVKTRRTGPGRMQLNVTTDCYAYFVKITVPIAGVWLSDNYFDLLPGEERVIEVVDEGGRDLREADISVSCL